MKEEIKEKLESKGMSRRSILKGAVALGAIAAGGGMASTWPRREWRKR